MQKSKCKIDKEFVIPNSFRDLKVDPETLQSSSPGGQVQDDVYVILKFEF